MATAWIVIAVCALLVTECLTSLQFVQNVFFDTKSDSRFYIDLTNEYFNNQSAVWLYNQTNKVSGVAQIQPPISQERKFSFSLMFWPNPSPSFDTSRPNCTKQLGINALPQASIVEHSTELINSMTFFERLRLNSSGNISNHFMAVALDKTSPKSTVSRTFFGKFDEVWVDGYSCDSVLHVRNDKSYIFCWKAETVVPLGSNTTLYKLNIKARIWNPRLNEDTNSTQMVISLTKVQYDSFQANPAVNRMLRTIGCKSFDSNVIDVAFFFRNQSFISIVRMTNDKFSTYIYPTAHNGKDGELPLIELKENNGLRIYNMEYVDDYRFLITEMVENFNEWNSTTYGNMHYLDAARTSKPQFVGQGMIVTFTRGVDQENNPVVSEVMLIRRAVNNSNTNPGLEDPITLYIQLRKYYKGYFYGDQMFLLKINGRPRFFKGFTSRNYFIYVDYSPALKSPECGNAVYYNGRIRIAQNDRPDVYRTIMNFDQNMSNPLKVLVTSNHNMIYIRYPHKLEIFELVEIGVDLSKQVRGLNMTMNTSAGVDSIIRLLATQNSTTYPNLSDIYTGQFIHLRGNGQNQVDELTTNRVEQPTTTASSAKINITYHNWQFSYPGLLGNIGFGNFLAFQERENQPLKARMDSFEKSFMSLSLNPGMRIKKIFCVNVNSDKFVLISYELDKGNFVYKFSPKTNQSQLVMTLHDNRPVDSLQRLVQAKFLAHIEGLLYELDFDKLTLVPVFKSNDFCGEIYTTITHNELGSLTVCGGRSEITIFITDPRRKKVDLSTPLNNIRVNPTLFFTIKTEKISHLFSSSSFMNRFATLSEPIKMDPFSEGGFVAKVRIRLFEVCSSKQSVEVIPEFEQWLFFRDTIEDISAYIIEDRLLVFTYHKTGTGYKESIHIFAIGSTYNLELDKIVTIPEQFKLNFKTHKPLSTYLPVKKTLMTRLYGPKIILMVSMKTVTKDIISNFDFFDYQITENQQKGQEVFKNFLAVIDPKRSSIDCIKFVELPLNYSIFSFGHYFIESTSDYPAIGAVVAAEKDNSTRIYFMDDHSLSVDFYSYPSFDAYFKEARRTNLDYTFGVRNFLAGKSKEIEMSISLDVNTRSNVALSTLREELDVDLVEQDGNPKRFWLLEPGPNGQMRDLIGGFPYEYNFQYDSWIENMAGKIEADMYFKMEQYPEDKVAQVMDTIAYRLFYKASENTFSISSLERTYPVQTRDYVDLLFASSDITQPVHESKSKSKDLQPNVYLSAKHRCTKFFYKQGPKSETYELVSCIEIETNSTTELTINSLAIYLFDERAGPDNLYSELKTETPVIRIPIDIIKMPFSDIRLASTLNHFALFHTNPTTNTTYKYSIFRVSRHSNGTFGVTPQYSEEVWLIDLKMANTFYQTPGTEVVTERFCTVGTSKLESILLAYYCFVYDPAKPEVFLPQVRTVSIFKHFGYEDLNLIMANLLIYNPQQSPVATDEHVVKDPLFYFMFSFPSYLTVFARIDPSVNSTENYSDNKFAFALLCDPFEGYKFKADYNFINERYYAKASVLADSSFLTFYSLPSAYTELRLDQYTPYFTVEQLNTATFGNKPTCIQPKFSRRLSFPVEDSAPLRFGRKKVAEVQAELDKDSNLGAVGVASTVQKRPLVYEKTALQFLLKGAGKKFYRVEYLPRLEVRSSSTLLLSDNIIVDVKGMFNTSRQLKINLKSGKFTQFWFVVKYLLPLLLLVGILFGLHWAMGYLFRRMKIDTSMAENKLGKNGLMRNLNGMFDKIGKKSKTGPDGEISKREKRLQEEVKSIELSLQDEVEREKIQLEQAKKHLYKREAMGIPLLSEDPELVEDLEHADYMRQLYSRGILQIDLLPEEQEELNARVVEEGPRSYLTVVGEQELGVEVPEQTILEFKEFEAYMEEKRLEAIQKMSSVTEPEKPTKQNPKKKTKSEKSDEEKYDDSKKSSESSDEEKSQKPLARLPTNSNIMRRQRR